jgi:hypothetical protein
VISVRGRQRLITATGLPACHSGDDGRWRWRSSGVLLSRRQPYGHRRGRRLRTRGHADAARTEAAAPAAAPAVGAGSASGSVASEASARGQDRPLHAPLTRCEGTTGAPQLARRHNAIVGYPLALTSSLPSSLPPSAVRGSSRRAGVAVASQLVGCREEFFLIRVCNWGRVFSSAGRSGPSGYNDGYTGYG